MRRSIDLLESRAAETDNCFAMTQRGYAFLSATPDGTARHKSIAEAVSKAGGGSVRVCTGADHGEVYAGDSPYDAAPNDALQVFSDSEAVAAFLSGMPQFVSPEVPREIMNRFGSPM